MLLEIPEKGQKNAKITPDFFKKCHLNSKNALFYFKQNVQTLTLYAHTVLLFPRRLYLPEVDCSDRSLVIDDGTGLSCKSIADAILTEQEKELPADHPYFFFRWF